MHAERYGSHSTCIQSVDGWLCIRSHNVKTVAVFAVNHPLVESHHSLQSD